MDFTVLGVNPESLAFVYAWGVASVMGLFTLGYATGAAVSAVKRL